jgi:serine/threonine-protein kinase
MGTVHSAEDVELKREVAIKFLALELVEDPLSRERFNRECQTLARLKSHQNVVTIYAKGEWEGLPYCVMEYVDGRSVKDVLRREMKFAPARAVDVCRQAAAALDFVWRQARLVHRDVKPSNLMYDREERTVKLTDFGLAKAQTNLTESGLTQSGVILGTPDYLSPEQARGERDLDFRTDVYALGATLYHLLTGQTPFPSKSVADVVAAHLHTPPPDPGALVKLPPALGALVQRMLAKQAKDRPATYDALGAELSAALTTN